MPYPQASLHPIAQQRAARGWSQSELARRARVPRTSVHAMEGRRLTPSVTAALSIARALGCAVEELFGETPSLRPSPAWALPPVPGPCRFWEAEVGGRVWRYPVESVGGNPIPHDGVARGSDGAAADVLGRSASQETLVMACCDPSAGLLASEYKRSSGFRLLVLSRGGAAALDLLRQGCVHVAGVHRATPEQPGLNAAAVRERVGAGTRLMRVARWDAGLALPAGTARRSVSDAVRRSRRWALREPGSAARECLEGLVGPRPLQGRPVPTHAAVAEAVRAGWAEAGICVRLVAAEAGLTFLPVRTECLDLCFPSAFAGDPRAVALIRLLRSPRYRQLVGDLPGYDVREMGEAYAA